jgi:hypothetical protein
MNSVMKDIDVEHPETGQAATNDKPRLKVFRFDEIEPIYSTGDEPFWITNAPLMAEGFRKLVDTGWLEGIEFRVLLDVPGFNLAYGRLKPGYAVPLHFHQGHGVYFITAGSGRYGNVELKAGDGLFQPARSPYTLTAGEAGLELIEIRTVFGGGETYFMSNSEKYWAKFAQDTIKARETWSKEWPKGYGTIGGRCKAPTDSEPHA